MRLPAALSRFVLFGIAVSFLVAPDAAFADWFGTGDNRFEIPFVTIGSPGNAADTTGAPNPAGRVDYTYRIGKYEVPEEAVRKANAASALAGNPLGITLDTRGPQKPATSLSWFEAARFVNWLNEDVGASPAYKFDTSGAFQLWTPSDAGFSAANPFRNSLARYVLPSVDEWYKAAYYDPVADVWWDYPTGSNDPPIPVVSGNAPGTAVYNQSVPADVLLAGGESQTGIVGMAGNAAEWQETAFSGKNLLASERRTARGGWWTDLLSSNYSSSSNNSALPDVSSSVLGIRVVRIPEPDAAALLLFGISQALLARSIYSGSTL